MPRHAAIIPADHTDTITATYRRIKAMMDDYVARHPESLRLPDPDTLPRRPGGGRPRRQGTYIRNGGGGHFLCAPWEDLRSIPGILIRPWQYTRTPDGPAITPGQSRIKFRPDTLPNRYRLWLQGHHDELDSTIPYRLQRHPLGHILILPT